MPPNAAKSKGDVDLCDVWRQAFGKGGVGSEKKANVKAEVKAEPAEEKAAVQRRKKTILDVPPEARRRPRPSYGGLIHFAPDWEAKVRNEYCFCVAQNSIPSMRFNANMQFSD